MMREIGAVKKSFTKFEGQKTGWDVSIVGPEFQQGTAEAVLVTKEDPWTRYFFFFEDGLYKMFLAFNKDALQGKSFADFGKSMEARYGNARAVYRDEKTKGGINHMLDHFAWNAGPDRLKLVDRSEFYGVYCLVLYDQSTHERVVDKRKIVNPGTVEKDELVEAVATPRKGWERRERRHHRSRRRPRDQEAGDRGARRHRRAVHLGQGGQALRGERQVVVRFFVVLARPRARRRPRRSRTIRWTGSSSKRAPSLLQVG